MIKIKHDFVAVINGDIVAFNAISFDLDTRKFYAIGTNLRTGDAVPVKMRYDMLGTFRGALGIAYRVHYSKKDFKKNITFYNINF